MPQTISPFFTFLHLHPHNCATFSGSVAAETFQGLKSDPSELSSTLVFMLIPHPTNSQILSSPPGKYTQDLTAGASLCLTVLGQLLPSPPDGHSCPPTGFPASTLANHSDHRLPQSFSVSQKDLFILSI